MQFAHLLKPEEVEQIHEASLEILEAVGVLVHNPKGREVYRHHGCKVDRDTGIVQFPRGVVENFRRAFVPQFTFSGRDPQYDRTIPDDRPVIITGSSAPDVIDLDTGEERRATSTDIANIAYLINELPGYDVFSISTLADDAPQGQYSLSRFYPSLKNCLKPVRSNTPNMEDLMPILSHHYCPSVSPLSLDVESLEALMYLTEKGLPVYGTIVPNAGLTGPMTVSGTLTLGNAEFLALGVLMQMIQPHTPLIYAVLSTVADLRSGAYAPGAIETGMLQMAHSQMAGFYNVPSGGYIGLTNAQVNDAQCGYETGMNVTAALLGGTDMFNMGGLLGGLMAFDFAKAVIDSEIAMMLKRIKQGLEFSRENMALDVIAETGPGGNYMDKMHTMEHMRSAAFFPELAVRDLRDPWKANGRPDSQSRAMEQARRILTRDNPAVFSAEVDAKIRARFAGLVSGDAGWKK